MAPERPSLTWRYADLLVLPDDGRRHEIIEGELFELPSPGWDHQTAEFNLVTLLAPTVRKLDGVLRFAPLNVFMRGADPVQPDVIVLLPGGGARPAGRGVEGPPDLLIEVIGPATRGRDLLTKRMLYARAGVREYWIVDPEGRTVSVHSLDRDLFPEPVTVGAGGRITSPLLGAEISAADVFVGTDEAPSEA